MPRDSERRLQDKVAIVTGAGRGLGRAEALALAEAGAAVVVNEAAVSSGEPARSAEAVVQEIIDAGGEAASFAADVSSYEAVANLIEFARDRYGRLDVVINNAGIARPAAITEMTTRDWDDVIAVHLKGHFNLVRLGAPLMVEQGGGAIVNTASTSGVGHYGMANYSAAKEGVVGFTRAVARDLAEAGVRCNAIRPLAGDTGLGSPELFETLRYSQEVLGIPGSGELWVDETAEHAPSSQVGLFATWLCTDAAAAITGRTFFVGGGKIGVYAEPVPEREVIQPSGWTLETLDAHCPAALIGLRKNWAEEVFARKQKANTAAAPKAHSKIVN